MKKVISVILSVATLLSIVAMPMAVQTGGGEGNVPADTGTDVVLSGKYAEAYYQVTVPATMSPGDSGQVKVVGAWEPSQTLKVTCPNKVTLTYGDQTLDVGITFEGIEQAGSLLDEFSITKDISVENKTVMFGTWTGKIVYNVEIVEFISFSVNYNNDITTYYAEEGMTWGEWVESDYNTDGYFLVQDVINPEYYLVTNEHRHALDGLGEWGPERGIDLIVDGKEYNWMIGGTLSGPIYSA